MGLCALFFSVVTRRRAVSSAGNDVLAVENDKKIRRDESNDHAQTTRCLWQEGSAANVTLPSTSFPSHSRMQLKPGAPRNVCAVGISMSFSQPGGVIKG